MPRAPARSACAGCWRSWAFRTSLAPPIGSPLRGEFLQWVHFAESTAYPPIGVIVWHTLFERNADRFPEFIESARGRALEALDFVERRLEGRDHLLGAEVSAADIMMGFTLFVARALGLLEARHVNLTRYVAQLERRQAFQTAAGP